MAIFVIASYSNYRWI